MPTVATSSPLWAAVTASHRVRVRVEVWGSSGYLATLYPTDGQVTVDATRAVRRNLDLTIADNDGTLTPTVKDSLLAPFNGNEIKVWRGVTYPDGTYDEAPLGVFRITNVDVRRGEDGITLAISAEDRGWWMSRLTYTSTFPIAADTNVTAAVQTVIEDRLPGIPMSLATTVWKTPGMRPGIDGNTDPLQFVRELANTAGMEFYFDANGVATLAAIPNLDGDTVVTYTENATTGVLLDVSRGMSIESNPNGVRVTVEASTITFPWASVRWDEDPNSPTYRDPSIPTEPPLATDALVEFSTPLIPQNADGTGNTDQSDGMAAALLQTVIGQPLSLSVVPNPALDVRDRIGVVSARLGVSTTAMVDSFTIPLTATGSMTIAARARRLTT